MKSSICSATIVTGVFIATVAALPPAQAIAPCYTVVAGVLTDGKDCTGDVIVDATVTTIGAGAFDVAGSDPPRTGPTSVTLPSTVTLIADEGFRNAIGLSTVFIGTGITSIPAYAFADSGLTSLTLPSHVTSIGESAFRNTSSLESISLGEGITSIPANAFDSSGLLSVTIPTQVTSIGVGAFTFTSSLTSVDLGTGLTTIGASAFEGSGLTSLTIPSNVTSMGDQAFERTSALASVTFGAGLSSIPDYAFKESGLTSLTLPSTITSIGLQAFQDTRAMTSVSFGSGITSIPDYGFERSGLTTVTIPSTVTTIGHKAFRDTRALTSVSLGTGVTTISSYAFEYSGLTSLIIPPNVTSLGQDVFRETRSMTSVSLSPNLTSIPDRAFEYSGLTSVIIPSAVTSIGANAFTETRALTSVGLGSGVSTLALNSFVRASSLRCVRASGNAPSAENTTFNSTPLRSLLYLSGTTGWTSPWFGLTTSAQTLTPASGTQWGGTSVTLNSCGLSSISRVLFGGVSASFSVTSDGSLTAITPVGTPGAVDVEVQDALGSRQKVATYTYVAAPAPSSPSAPVEPVVGPVVAPTLENAPVVVVAVPPVTSNPAVPTRVATGVVLISESQAQATPQRVMRNTPANMIGDAPVVKGLRGVPIALVIPGLTPGVTYQTRIRVDGEYRDLGSTRSADGSEAALPVFRLTRLGMYTIALISPVDGSARYIKIRVSQNR